MPVTFFVVPDKSLLSQLYEVLELRSDPRRIVSVESNAFGCHDVVKAVPDGAHKERQHGLTVGSVVSHSPVDRRKEATQLRLPTTCSTRITLEESFPIWTIFWCACFWAHHDDIVV